MSALPANISVSAARLSRGLQRPGYVYCIRDDSAGAVKIGFSKNLRAAFRLKAKQEAETDDDREHQAIVDTYLAALHARDTREAGTEERSDHG